MKHLIICGPQASGKSLLASFIQENGDVQIIDEVTAEEIKVLVTSAKKPRPKPIIFLTQDNIQFGRHITQDKFIIINLK